MPSSGAISIGGHLPFRSCHEAGPVQAVASSRDRANRGNEAFQTHYEPSVQAHDNVMHWCVVQAPSTTERAARVRLQASGSLRGARAGRALNGLVGAEDGPACIGALDQAV